MTEVASQKPTDKLTPENERGKVLSGRAVANEIQAEVQEAVAAWTAAGRTAPGLTAVLVGEDPASQVYVRNKRLASEKVGIHGEVLHLPTETSEEELLATLDRLNADDAVDGILVQLPLPPHINTDRILDRIALDKDVDGYHAQSVGNLWLDRPGFLPATPAGIIELLKRHEIELSGLHAVIVGRSPVVGKPMAGLLLRENCTVTVCHSRTRDLEAVCQSADLLVAAIGRPAMIGPEHVREGAIVIDVGINRVSDRADVERLFPGDAKRLATWEKRGATLVGDVDYVRVAPKSRAITPVPGGVGPLTIAMLLVNTLEAARRRRGE